MKDETAKREPYFRRIGWGPFPTPWEKRRRAASQREADKLLIAARQLDVRPANTMREDIP